MKKVLIVGGTARSAKYIIDVLENEKYLIDLITYRQKNKIYGQYNWQHLDLEDDTSVNNFIKKMILTLKYQMIILIIKFYYKLILINYIKYMKKMK